MSAPRFYCPFRLQADSLVDLPDALAHYALRVLRLDDGAPVTLFDGYGGEYPARLVVAGRRARAQLGEHKPREAESGGRVRLAQGLATGAKMDWIIEKAVELGASELIPIAAQHSTLQLRGERLEKRLQHWQRIAQAASEQCGRNRIMHVAGLTSLAQYLDSLTPGPAEGILLCHPDYGKSLQDAIAQFRQQLERTASEPPALTLLVGPEGGWSEAELALAARHRVTPVQFGPRILRTETAGLALIAACTALLGW